MIIHGLLCLIIILFMDHSSFESYVWLQKYKANVVYRYYYIVLYNRQECYIFSFIYGLIAVNCDKSFFSLKLVCIQSIVVL